MTTTTHTTAADSAATPNPGAPVFAAELVEELGAVVLTLNEDINLDTPEATRRAAYQALALSTRMYTLADQQASAATPPAACPDGRPFCTGDPADHTGPMEAVHRGPAHSITGPYGRELLAFNLEQFDDGRVGIAFFGNGDWPTLDLAEADRFITDATGHLGQFRAVRAQLAAIERGTTTATAASPAEPRTFTFPLRDGSTLTETCPGECNIDHQPQTESPQHAEDIWHHIGDEPSVSLTVFDPEQGTAEDRFLSAQVTVAPHANDPRSRVPHVNLEIAQQYSVMEGLTPDEFGTVIDKFAAHVDQLRGVHARLVQARADWQARA